MVQLYRAHRVAALYKTFRLSYNKEMFHQLVSSVQQSLTTLLYHSRLFSIIATIGPGFYCFVKSFMVICFPYQLLRSHISKIVLLASFPAPPLPVLPSVYVHNRRDQTFLPAQMRPTVHIYSQSLRTIRWGGSGWFSQLYCYHCPSATLYVCQIHTANIRSI